MPGRARTSRKVVNLPMTNEELRRSGLVHFHGFKLGPQGYIGQLTYTGVVTFASGRKQRVYYFASTRAVTHANSYAHPQTTLEYEYVEWAMYQAFEEVQKTIAWAKKGVLRRWLSPRADRRRTDHHRSGIVSVRWDIWDRDHSVQDNLEGVVGPFSRWGR